MKSTSPIEIVSAERADIPRIAQLEKKLNATHSWSQKTFENLLEDETCWTWVAKKEGVFAGYLVCQLIGEEAELHDIAIEQTFRRQGIGRQLLNLLRTALKEKGVRKLFLLVRRSNLSAQKLYTSIGFRPIGVRPDYYGGPKEDALLFLTQF